MKSVDNQNADIRMAYIGTHVVNLQDSMAVVFEAAKRTGIELYWAADFSGFRGNPDTIPCKLLQVCFTRHPIVSPKNILAIIQLSHHIRENQINVLHCNTPIGSFCGRIAGRITHTPLVIYTAHGLPFYQGAPWWRVVFKLIEHGLARYTDYAVAMNNEDYRALSRMHFRGNRVYKIDGVGVPIKPADDNVRAAKRKELGIPIDAAVAICVGRLEKVKGTKISIEAFANIQNPNSYLLICGQGKEKGSLERLVDSMNIMDRVLFLGFRDDVFDLLQASDVYMLNSHYEGLPRSLMEAMNAKTVCLVSNARGNIDIIKNRINGLVAPDNNPKSTGELLNELFKNQELRMKLSRKAFEDVQKYSMDVVLSQFVEIYNDARNAIVTNTEQQPREMHT